MNGTPGVLGVLIIDDNAAWAERVVQIIEHALPFSSRRVRWEATLADGRRALQDFHADRVWLDLDLSDSRPPETIEAIDSFPEPVYVFSDHFDKFSGGALSKIAMACIEHGAHRCYTKDLDTVRWVVNEMAQAHVVTQTRAAQQRHPQQPSPVYT